MANKKVVALGGGKGTRVVIKALANKKNIDLAAIMSVFDSGTSTGRLRRDFDVPALGDLRKLLTESAGSKENEEILRTLFEVRFDRGELEGHSLGNLILLGLFKTSANFKEMIQKAIKLLGVKNEMLPSSLDNSDIVAEFENGHITEGETYIDVPESDKRDPKLRIRNLYSKPLAKAYSEAVKAIKEADLVIIGPGDLYTSIIANFTVKGIPNALRETKAKTIYICNIPTKPGETYGMSAAEHTEEILKYTKLKKLDYVLVNNKFLPGLPPGIEFTKVDEGKLKKLADKVIITDLVNPQNPQNHDPKKLEKVLIKLI